MKTLFAFACLLLVSCASAFGADAHRAVASAALVTVSAPDGTLKEGVLDFFAKRRRAGVLFSINEVIEGRMPDKAKASVFSSSSAWVDELVSLESRAKDDPKDKRLVLDMRRAAVAIERAQKDKAMVGEAVRALASLKASAR